MNLMLSFLGGMALYYFKYVTGNEGMFQIYNGCAVPIIGLIGLLTVGFIAPQNALLVAIGAFLVRSGGGLIIASSTVMLADVYINR